MKREEKEKRKSREEERNTKTRRRDVKYQAHKFYILLKTLIGKRNERSKILSQAEKVNNVSKSK